MKKFVVLVVSALALVGAIVAHADPASGAQPPPCGWNAVCHIAKLFVQRSFGDAIVLAGDGGIRFGDGTFQNTATAGGTGAGADTEVAVWHGVNISGDGGLVYSGGVLGVDSLKALDAHSQALQLGDKTQVNAYAVSSFFQGTALEKVFGFNKSDSATGLAAGVSSYILDTTPLDSFGEYTGFYGEVHASSNDNFLLDGGFSSAFIYGADLEVYADHDAGSYSQVAGLFLNAYNNKLGEVDTVDGVAASAGISHGGNAINVYGGNFTAFTNPGNYSGVVYGVYGVGQIAGASDGGGDVAGVVAKGIHQDSAVTTGNVYGIGAQATSSAASTGLGTSNSIIAGRFNASNAGATIVGEVSGLHVDALTGTGGATNAYGLYIGDQSTVTATNKYAWYAANGPSYVDSTGALTLGVPLALTSGGTGQTTANAAALALLPSTSGASGKFLTNNGSTTLSWGSVSGNTYNAYASRPAPGTSGNMFTCTNCPVASWVDDGAAWHPIITGNGSVVGTQPKAAASFTNFGAGSPSATLTDRNGALHYSWDNATVVGSTTQGFFESLSSATAHVEAIINPDGQIPTSNTGAVDWGVFMRESGSGKMITFTISMANNSTPFGQEYESIQWTSATARTGAAVTPTMITSSSPQFLKIVRSGANILSQYSTDGQNWTTLNSRSTASIFTTAPDQVGVIGIQWFTNDAIGFNVLHYLSGS